jgi:hypothetical protein
VGEHSHLRKSNYFYYNCLTGKFPRDNCPSYLRKDNFAALQSGLIERLTISTRFFLDELRARKFTRVGGLVAVHALCVAACASQEHSSRGAHSSSSGGGAHT